MVPPDWRVQQKDKLGWPAIRKDGFVGRRFRLTIHVGAHEVRVPLELVGRGAVSSRIVADERLSTHFALEKVPSRQARKFEGSIRLNDPRSRRAGPPIVVVPWEA